MFTKQQRMLLFIFAVCAFPFVGGTLMYFFYKPEGRINYGHLVETKPIAMPTGKTLSGLTLADAQFKNQWWVVHHCSANCETELYASRQARTMLNKDRTRVQRLVMSTTPPAETLRAQHPDAQWIVVPIVPPQFAAQEGVLLVDYLQNQVLLWPRLPDIKRMHKDLSRLMRVNRTD